MSQLACRRVLLKLSGEALMGDEDYGIDPKVIGRRAPRLHGSPTCCERAPLQRSIVSRIATAIRFFAGGMRRR